MTTEILPNLYKIQIPLPGNPLKALNSYLIKGKKRHLLIDTGFNRPECKEAMIAALKKLEVNPADCDFFLTHLHADHTGLVSSLATSTSRVYCSKIDGEAIIRYFSGDWHPIGDLLVSHGFPQENLQAAIEKHPANQNRIEWELKPTYVDDGDFIEADEYRFVCYFTPGHTPGHVCLYEPKRHILISGDHILDNISPNITVWPQMADSLMHYLNNLEKIAKLDINLVLPGHRCLIRDCQKRIRELKAHHEQRLEELVNILKSSKDPLTAYEAAARLTWNLTYRSWEEFPFPQKWFATGEAAANLEYLALQGIAKKGTSEGKFVFTL